MQRAPLQVYHMRSSPRISRSFFRRYASTESSASAPDYGRTFRVALGELLRHDAQAELKDGSYLITASHRSNLPERLLHEIIPLHESLLRRMCQVPTWHIYSQNKGATMMPIKPTEPHGPLTIPLFSQRPIPLPHATASEILELPLAALLANLPDVLKQQPRLTSLAIEPRGLDFNRCLHLQIRTAAVDLGDVATALHFEEGLTKSTPSIPRALPLWVFQQGSSLFSTPLGPAYAASTAPDPLLEHLASAHKLEPAKDTAQLSRLGAHTHAFTFEGRAIQFAQRHKLFARHRMMKLPAEIVFKEAKEQKHSGVYIHLSNGGVAMTLS